MGSLYLNRLSRDEYQQLKEDLWETQKGTCFICEQPIDLHLHSDSSDIDHVVPLQAEGKDDPSNFALTHSHCNRSKLASDLRIARLLARFERLSKQCADEANRPNLSDVLQLHKGARFRLPIEVKGDCVRYTFPDLRRTEIVTAPIYHDKLSGMDYFFAVVPIEYMFHDSRINPRAVATSSLRKLMEEFNAGLPQLQAALAWVQIAENQRSAIEVFDGQHKVAAQVLLGVTEVPLRVFVNPDLDKLLTANTHAGTVLRQVAFDKSVQRRLGSQLLADRIERYLTDLGLPVDFVGFSEKELVNHFKGQSREVKRYILDDIRFSIISNTENRLRSFVDFGGRSTELPLSYSSVEKTFFSFFIHQDLLSTPLNYLMDRGENPRDLEKQQIINVMNIIADTIYIHQYDPTIGTSRLENRVQQGEEIPPAHLRAFRMSKEEILHAWLGLVVQVVQYSLTMQGTIFDKSRPFQYQFPQPLWQQIERLVENLANLPLWVNTSLSATVFGGKQPYEYWRHIFETGNTQSGQKVLTEPINLMNLIS